MILKWISRTQPYQVFLLTLLLFLPAFFSGYLGDDYIHHAMLSPELTLPKANDWSVFGLFSWVDASPERNHYLMDQGVIPWWTYEGMRYQFWRPIAELSHWIDHELWHGHAWMMHLHSVLWYLLLGGLLRKLYIRSGLSEPAALVAFFAFMLDSTHGMTVGWIANRNAIISAVFGVLCLLTYLDWNETKSRKKLIASVLLLAASLFSAEIGISTTCYLGAHALAINRRGIVKGVMSLWPYILVSVLWWVTYKLGHFGANNSDVNYIDPLESPIIFLSNLGARIPVVLFSQFGIIPADVYGFGTEPFTAYLVVSVIFLLIIGYLLFPLLKQSAIARFWLLGAFLSVFPISTTIPSDRNLLFVGLGASALIGLLYEALRQENTTQKLYRVLASVILFLHLVISPLLLPVTSFTPRIMNLLMGLDIAAKLPVKSNDENILILGLPMPIALGTMPQLFARNLPLPHHIWLLSSLQNEFSIEGISEASFLLRSKTPMVSGIEEVLRDIKKHPLAPGFSVQLSGVRVVVQDVDNLGHPMTLALTFEKEALQHSRVVVFKNWKFEDIVLPGIGQTLEQDLRLPSK